MRLSPRVLRVTAQSGDALINSYFIGGERDEWALINACPDDEAHAAALRASAPGAVRQTLTWHGLAASDGERLEVGGCTLRAVRVPDGPNVLACCLLEEEKLLFVRDAAQLSGFAADEVEWLAPASGFLRRA